MTGRKNENPLYHKQRENSQGFGRKTITLEYYGYLCKLNIIVSTSLIILEAINKVPCFI